jgi:hypothetical protein
MFGRLKSVLLPGNQAKSDGTAQCHIQLFTRGGAAIHHIFPTEDIGHRFAPFAFSDAIQDECIVERKGGAHVIFHSVSHLTNHLAK